MSDLTVKRRFWRLLTITLFFMAMLLFVASSFLWEYYFSSHPRVAQPQLGMIYALNYHGIPVYLTKVEYFWLRFLEGTGVTSFVASLLIWVFVLKQRRLDDVR
jgi:hypothetical protein